MSYENTVLRLVLFVRPGMFVESCTPWRENKSQIVDFAFNLYFLLHFIIRVRITSLSVVSVCLWLQTPEPDCVPRNDRPTLLWLTQYLPPFVKVKVKVKVKVCVLARLKTSSALQSRKWQLIGVHELMMPWRIMRPSTARYSERFDRGAARQIYHRPNQSH